MARIPTFYWNAQPAWEAMYIACEAAHTSIDLEMYQFAADTYEFDFARLFIKKVSQGVRVRLLLDGVGSVSFQNSSACARLLAAGVEVVFFNPVASWRLDSFLSWFFRDHRKLLVVDGTKAFMGSVNISGRMRAWRDTQVGFEGACAVALQRSFEVMLAVAKTPRILQFQARFPKPVVVDVHTTITTHSPRFHQRFIYKQILAAIKRARVSLLIQTPYFVPSMRFMRALHKAAKRGVAVQLMIPQNFDPVVAGYATHSYVDGLLKRGITVLEYGPAFLHAKMIVVDDVWATVGSANIDNLSLLLNYELNIQTTDPSVVAVLKRQFFSDVPSTTAITRAAWKKRGGLRKFFEWLTIPLHEVL